MSFEITFLGASGGPIEGNTCSVLLKPANLSYENILEDNLNKDLICIDAGCGMGKLTEIIHQESKFKKPNCDLLNYYPDCESIDYYYHENIQITTPFEKFNPYRSILHTQQIFNHMENYLITHSHLDHVSGLIINSAGFNNKLLNKFIYGSHCTINSIQKHLFNGTIWPNMPSFNIVNLRYMDSSLKYSTRIGNYDVRIFDLSHGEFNKLVEEEKEPPSSHRHHRNNSLSPSQQQSNNNLLSVPSFGMSDHPRRRSSITTIPPNSNGIIMKNSEALNHHYISSAFLIKHQLQSKSILLFGDFESDLTSKLSKNLLIWKNISNLILNNQLSGIILECSNSIEINSDQLYGHLTPKLLIHELKQLENECKKLNPKIEKPLSGLNIIINHVKEPILEFDDGIDNADEIELQDPRKKILIELNKMNDIDCQFSIALGGTSIII